MYFLQIVINVTVETFFITACAYAQQCIGQYYTVGLQYVGYSIKHHRWTCISPGGHHVVAIGPTCSLNRSSGSLATEQKIKINTSAE